jgi:hypothetical protein
MIIGRVLWTQEHPFPPRRIGKCVTYMSTPVYVYDQPVIFHKLQAFGVSETVLVEMIRDGVQLIHYVFGSDTYMAQRDEVLTRSQLDTAMGARKGYLYLPLRRWQVHPGKLAYAWVQESQRVDLPWRIDAPELADWKARIVAARPVEPRQMGLFA